MYNTQYGIKEKPIDMKKLFVIALLLTATTANINAQEIYDYLLDKSEQVINNPQSNNFDLKVAQFKATAMRYFRKNIIIQEGSISSTWLDEQALAKILTEPKNALCKQYQKLLDMDGIELTFEEDAVRAASYNPACAIGADALVGTVKDGKAHGLLHFSQDSAQIGLAHIQVLCRLRNRSHAFNLDHVLQMLNIHMLPPELYAYLDM